MVRCVLVWVCGLVLAAGAQGAPLATTAHGVVQGVALAGDGAGAVRVWKGIPYAAPPVAARRFQPPQPPMSWVGERLATRFAPVCAQTPYPPSGLFGRSHEPSSEDCLYLNVWSAVVEDAAPAPVMVWIHGGALTRGSGSTSWYDGTRLAQRGVVVVTINYRLGPFGYLAHPALSKESSTGTSGNYGTLDQVAALAWVQQNIAAFGGDPDNVTIFGESAGSWSVNHLTATPLAKGLFHKAIGQSGARFSPMPELRRAAHGFAAAEAEGVRFANALGAADAAALRALPAEVILAGYSRRSFPQLARAVVDGHVFPDHVANIHAKGQQHKVPLLLGSNADEATNLVPRPDTPERAWGVLESFTGESADALAAAYGWQDNLPRAYYSLLRDLVFTWEMRTWADVASRQGQPVWLYWFAHAPPMPLEGRLGAYHAAEIPYVFDNGAKAFDGAEVPAREQHMANIMATAWVAFAKTGRPMLPGGVAWPRYNPEAPAYMVLQGEPAPGQPVAEDELAAIAAAMAARWARD